jgi:hypothetical protein
VSRLRLAVLVALLACDDATAPRCPRELDAGTSPISFASLRVGDELRVRSHSQGCFHDHTALIKFTPLADGGAAVYAIVVATDTAAPWLRYWFANGHIRSVAQPPRDTTLSPHDLASLDSLLAYYRAPRAMGCTTVDTLSFTLRHDGRTLKELYVDGSCGLMQYKGLTLYQLIPWVILRPAASR